MALMVRRARFGSSIPTSSMADIAFLLLIFFLVTTIFDEDKGLSLVLPQDEPQEIAAKNILQLIVRPDGVIEVKRSDGMQAQLVRQREISSIWRHESARNEQLIAVVRTYPDAAYHHMIDVLDQLKQAGAQRISLQRMTQ